VSAIQITYCKPCGYRARAQRVADALRDQLGVQVELVAGKGGIFEIAVDGKMVARRRRDGFPSEDEIVAAVGGALR